MRMHRKNNKENKHLGVDLQNGEKAFFLTLERLIWAPFFPNRLAVFDHLNNLSAPNGKVFLIIVSDIFYFTLLKLRPKHTQTTTNFNSLRR